MMGPAVPVGQSRLPDVPQGWFLLRFHWKADPDHSHPVYTYQPKPDMETVLSTAKSMTEKDFGDSLALTKVYVKRPHEDFWRHVA